MSPNRDFTMDLTKRGHFGGPILDPPPGGGAPGGVILGGSQIDPKRVILDPSPGHHCRIEKSMLRGRF